MDHLIRYDLFESMSHDLRADYDMINELMFGGELKRVPLRWMSTKYKLGVMAYGQGGEIEYVGISDFYELTRQQYLDVLAHEMIHVYMEQKGMRERDHHGPKFMSILDDLNRRFPEFKIAKSENANDFKAKSGSKVGTYGVVLFDMGKDDLSLVAVNVAAVDDKAQLDEFLDGLAKQAQGAFLREKSVSVEVYRSQHPDIPKFKIKRSLSLRSMELFVVNRKTAEEIRTDSELVSKLKIK